ncbi:T9SS type B sorting domain-containing protein [Flavobacterium sp. J372]|uniref:T9SS type B sorting domain-containing protein n=1 Tax=Flavobacterium sp. J372 TaxID=2898436 RepID=UPI0021516C8C|nr:T9SS type B sorting domain-containing protein [Flavobacterium sp. J372]MCR5860837.1 T9SS type B sorting domain-containing protein [Flavobacterium sp. J372]
MNGSVWARVDDPATGCYTTVQLQLIVVATPVLGAVSPIAECNDDYDNDAIFDLTVAGAQAVNGQPGLVVTYHTSLQAANDGTPLINNPSTYESQSGTVWIRVTDATGAGCYSTTSVALTVLPKPVVSTIPVYALCDNGDANVGYRPFDLTTRAAALTGGVTGVTVTYYAQQADIAANNPIANPATYTNTVQDQQTIYVVLRNTDNCTAEGQFTIKVNPLPVIDTALPTFYACEETPGQGQFQLSRNDAAVTLGAAGYNVIYYTSLAQAQAGGTAGVIGDGYISGPRTIGVRVEDEITGCASTTTLNLDVIPGPVASNPAPLQECDLNNDNVACFNLNPTLAQLTATIPNVTLTVHETEEGAEFNGYVIQPAQYNCYTNINANGAAVPTVYIRVQSTLTDCFDVVALQLIANPVPEATEPEPYHVCDDNTDGVAVFNLSTRNAEILGTQSPADYVVTYHTSQTAADAGTGAITNVTSYSSPSTTLYVRVTNNVASNPTGCYDVVALELVVDPLPVANTPVPYTLCDDNNPGDEREVFDLTTRIAAITGGATGVNVSFHLTMAAAQANTGAIATPEAYTNTSTVQTIFVRVANAVTGCYRVVLMDIRVEPLPQITMPPAQDLQACGANGYAVFDLQALEAAMINNGVGLVIRFYETLEDAQAGNNNYIANTSGYTNIIPNAQFIYLRIENTVTGCVNTQVERLELKVTAPPVLEELDNIVLCDQDSNDQDGETIVNLRQRDADVQAMLTGTGYTIEYFKQESFAQAGAPRITNPTTYIGTNGETIWVRATDGDDCFAIASFELEIGKPLQLTTPTPLAVCSNVIPSTGSATFNLTTKDNEILGPFGVGQGYTVEYFVQDPRTNTTAVAIANPEAYVKPAGAAQTLFVRVTGPEGCRSYTTLTLRVLPKPNPDTTPDALEECEDPAIGAGMAEFNLNDAEADIRNNDSSAIITFHTSMADAEAGTNAIPNAGNYQSAGATIYVRMTANTGNPLDTPCYSVVELQIVVNPLPVLGNPANTPAIRPYAQCQIPYIGTATFILNSHTPQILIGQNAADYNVRFFETLAAAQAGAPAMPNQYVSSVPQKQVWVRADNIATGCYAIGTFDLLIDLGAVANTPNPANVPDTCDNDGTNDGITQLNLTTMDADIIGAQPQPQFTVTYYEEDPRVNPAAVAIATPNAYVNTNSPDLVTVWAVVTNTATQAPCRGYVSIDILVERLPEPQLTGGTICVEYPSGAIVRPLPLDSGLDATHTFVWYRDGNVIPGATGPSYLAEEAGAYSVIATSATGCVSNPQTPVQVVRSSQAVPIGNGYTVSNAFSDNQTITITVEGYGSYEYRLDNGPWQASNIFTGVTPGDHDVRVRDTTADACEPLTIVDVSIIDYPNFFTPNGDGFNDRWNIVGLGSRNNNATAKIFIFDRYGKLIKQIASEGEGWDGTYMGSPVPADDYWFTVEYKEMTDGVEVTKEFKAHFSLKR